MGDRCVVQVICCRCSEFFGATSSTRLSWLVFGLGSTGNSSSRTKCCWRQYLRTGRLGGDTRPGIRFDVEGGAAQELGRENSLWPRRRRHRKPIQIFKSGTCLLTVTVIVNLRFLAVLVSFLQTHGCLRD